MNHINLQIKKRKIIVKIKGKFFSLIKKCLFCMIEKILEDSWLTQTKYYP